MVSVLHCSVDLTLSLIPLAVRDMLLPYSRCGTIIILGVNRFSTTFQRLSGYVTVFASPEAMALLGNKCCVAAHLFGPTHPYCLRAIGCLCEDDVQDVARPVRKLLRT